VKPELGQVWMMQSDDDCLLHPSLILGIYNPKEKHPLRLFMCINLETGMRFNATEKRWTVENLRCLVGDRIV
jgi:hypothetical protein